MSLADDLERLDALRKAGTLSDDEFARAKHAVLFAPAAGPNGDLARIAELERIDREWDRERKGLLLPGRYGSATVPRPWLGVVIAVAGVGFGLFWTTTAYTITSAVPYPAALRFFPFFGLFFIAASVLMGHSVFTKGLEYDRAHAAYRRRRAAV